MRLPYTDNPPQNLDSAHEQVLKRVQARRGERGLIPLDLTLLHAPEVADGWNSLLGAVRTKTSLSANIRELCMCRPALINKAWFEWIHHLPLLIESDSFKADPSKVETVRKLHPKDQGKLSDEEWCVLRYADAMTRTVDVDEKLSQELKGYFSAQEVVEITATCAAYNMVSRFLVALDVGECNGKVPENVDYS